MTIFHMGKLHNLSFVVVLVMLGLNVVSHCMQANQYELESHKLVDIQHIHESKKSIDWA